MGARLEPLATNDGLGTVCTRAHDVAGRDTQFNRVVPVCPVTRLSLELVRKCLGLVGITRRDRDLLEPSDPRYRAEMRARLDTSSDDDESLRVFSGEQVGGERRSRSRARGRYRFAVQERERAAVP